MIIFLLIFFGICAGFIGGMGMGGGTILVPMLTIFLSYNQKIAQGFNLLSFVIMAVFALVIHLKNGYIEKSILFKVILPSILFCIAGSFAANYIDSNILKILFGLFLIVLSFFEFYKILQKKEK